MKKPALTAPFFLILFFLLSCAPLFAADISDYRPVFKPYYEGKAIKVAVRQFERKGKGYILSLDPYSFETIVKEAGDAGLKWGVKAEEVENTPFMKALDRHTSHQEGLQNMGIKEGGAAQGVFLTIDMCPSKKVFDRDLFESTLSLPQFKSAPAPIAIAISGLWMERHRDEFEWILGNEKSGRLKVTWINHTYSHPYAGKERLEEDFMLTKGADLDQEILKDEMLMIEKGITPSPFFRFPGLVSDNELLKKLKTLSLIPVGSGAWLAKGEEPGQGSIILVHGNGNEEEGVRRLKEFYKKEDKDFKTGRMTLLPLKDAFVQKR